MDKDLVKDNMGIVVQLAKRYFNRVSFLYPNLDINDLISEGVIALYSASKQYSHTKGRFISYALPCIRRRMVSSLSKNSDISYRGKYCNAFGSRCDSFTLKEHRAPNDAELRLLAKESKITYKTALQFYNYKLCEAVTRNELLIANSNPFKDYYNQQIRYKILTTIKKFCTKKEQYILINFYGLNNKSSLTIREIADNLNLTLSWVAALKSRAEVKIKGSLDEIYRMVQKKQGEDKREEKA